MNDKPIFLSPPHETSPLFLHLWYHLVYTVVVGMSSSHVTTPNTATSNQAANKESAPPALVFLSWIISRKFSSLPHPFTPSRLTDCSMVSVDSSRHTAASLENFSSFHQVRLVVDQHSHRWFMVFPSHHCDLKGI